MANNINVKRRGKQKVWYSKCWHCDKWRDETTMINTFNNIIVCTKCFNKLDKNGCYGSVED